MIRTFDKRPNKQKATGKFFVNTIREGHHFNKDNDPMWLVNIIRQSSQESHQLSRRGDHSTTRNKDASQSSRKGFYSKKRAQHQYINSNRKDSQNRLAHSQTRVLRSSKNNSVTNSKFKFLNEKYRSLTDSK